MAYRFNNGLGAVTCDICNIIFDADLSYTEYKEIYSVNESDICWKCHKPIDNKNTNHIKNAKIV